MEPSQVRTEFGFQRTACGCERCSVYCRLLPGYLIPSDLERLIPAGEDPLTWAKVHLRAVMPLPGGMANLVPAQTAEGHCHWFEDGKCGVWQNSPYGCAFFDQHMSREEYGHRNDMAREVRLKAFENNSLYAQLWYALKQEGLVRAGRSEDLNRKIAAALEQAGLREGARLPDPSTVVAPQPLVELLTYTSLPCRRFHLDMQRAQRKFAESLTVHYLPVPMCPECNRFVEDPEPGQHRACEYARLAWTVRLVDAALFSRFHDWLMEREETPRLAEAHRYAVTLVGPDALNRVLTGPALKAELHKVVEIYGAAGSGKLPKLIAGRLILNGEANDETLFHFLKHYLGLDPGEQGR